MFFFFLGEVQVRRVNLQTFNWNHFNSVKQNVHLMRRERERERWRDGWREKENIVKHVLIAKVNGNISIGGFCA